MSNRDVVTPVGRLSYPHLFERQPALNPGDEGKYGAAIIFEEGTDLSDVKAAIIAAAKEKFGDKAMDLIQKGKLRLPLREDGEEKGYPENSVFFNARSKHQPSVVSRYKDPATNAPRVISDKSEMYPGCDVKFHVTAYGYDVSGNKGVALGLNHVLRYGDNDRLDGRRSAESVFGADITMPSETDLSALDGGSSDADDPNVDLSAFM